MAAPISEEQRAAVLAAARTGATRNEVARKTGVSQSTVSRVCAEAGISFDRSRTAVAVQARALDMRQARVVAAGAVLEDVGEARRRMHAATEPRDFYFLARSVGELASAHVRLVGVDGPPDESENARSMLGQLAEALGVRVRDADSAAEGGGPDAA